jgi:hypothetical protein
LSRVEQTDVDLTGSVTGLLVGVEHYCGYRQVSEAGAGAWSLNYPRSEPITSGTFRNADITCSITATNASGSKSVVTPAVTAPALTALPPSKLIDTTFRGAFAVDYESQLANVSASNCDPMHRPTDVQKDGSSGQFSNMGSFGIGKTSSYPAISLPCQNTAVAGTTYKLTYEVVLGGVNDKGAKLDVRDASGNSVLDNGVIDLGTNEKGQKIVTGTATLTIPAGASGDDLLLSVRLSVSTATGLKSGGDARLTLVTIEKS